MGFANRYIEKNSIFPPFINETPEKNLNLIVIIPCYREPDIQTTILNLKECWPTQFPVEIIIHVNSGENSPQSVVDQNNETENELNLLFSKISTQNKKFFIFKTENHPKKHAGAGLARKIAMDEAIHRFNAINNENGIIVSIDADTTCDLNFLVAIEEQYLTNPKTKGSNVYFEHPFDIENLSKQNSEAIIKYELYLRYYRQAMRYTGYPYAFHTIGSIFNVKASIYTAQGGMNRKQAGEDFYFLQKIFPLGEFHEINTTKVYPSSRESDRVPFGTGPMMKQIISNNGELKTYSFEAFCELKSLFDKTDELFTADLQALLKDIERISSNINDFLNENNFISAVKEVKDNSSNLENFRKRYFKWFNAFTILKYLNFSHSNHYSDIPIKLAASNLLEITRNIQTDNLSEIELLYIYRDIDLNSK